MRGSMRRGASIISAFSQPFLRKIIFALKYRFIPKVEEGLGKPNRFREALDKYRQTSIGCRLIFVNFTGSTVRSLQIGVLIQTRMNFGQVTESED